MITEQNLKQIFPNIKNAAEWAEKFNLYLPRYDITQESEVAMFLAQTGYETQQFTRLKENMNYSSVDRLLAVFPKYFKAMPRQAISLYVGNPEKVGNLVYANRMGNGDEKSGDGYKFRGRGLMHLTGKHNYAKFANFIATPEITNNPDLVAEVKFAILSAIWFWKYNNLSVPAMAGDVDRVTKIINGGTNGLEDRRKLYNRAMQCL